MELTKREQVEETVVTQEGGVTIELNLDEADALLTLVSGIAGGVPLMNNLYTALEKAGIYSTGRYEFVKSNSIGNVALEVRK